MDVPAFTQTTLLPAGDYTLTAIAASKTGEISFTGLRNSHGASVFGNCTPTCTVLNATAPVVTAHQLIGVRVTFALAREIRFLQAYPNPETVELARLQAEIEALAPSVTRA